MKTIYTILLLIIPISVIGQLTPANEISPFSNATDYLHQQFGLLNNSDEYIQSRGDSSKIVFNYADSTINSLDSMSFKNGAAIDNHETDTIYITESVTKIMGELLITGHVYEGEHASAQTYVSTPGTQTIGTGGTFERLNEGTIAYTGDHLHEFTHDDGRLTYISPTEISMTVAATVSVESGETAQIIQFRIAKNGATIAGTNMPVEFTAVNRNAAVPLGWLLDMAQNDYIEVWCTSNTNGDDVIINNLTMNITKH